MHLPTRLLLLACLVLSMTGCAITITSPAHNGTVTLPVPLTVTTQGSVGAIDTVLLDGNDLVNHNGGHYSFGSGPLACVSPGQHSLIVGAPAALSTRVSDTSTFNVTACPTCPVCPAGFLAPNSCQCCANGVCDSQGYANFGLSMAGTASCSGTSQANDCLNQNMVAICGSTASPAACAPFSAIPPTSMFAVQFSIPGNVSLSLVRVPIHHRSGTNSYQIYIAADDNGKPGAIVETLSTTGIRGPMFPVNSPVHVFSSGHPSLIGGAKYWLAIGPGAGDTVGSWNFSLADSPGSASSTYLVNNTSPSFGVPSIAGPWAPAGGPLRPAFEIDVR